MVERKKHYTYHAKKWVCDKIENDWDEKIPESFNNIPKKIIYNNITVEVFNALGDFLPYTTPREWKKNAVYYQHRRSGLRCKLEIKKSINYDKGYGHMEQVLHVLYP
jgi:hypothetical protein